MFVVSIGTSFTKKHGKKSDLARIFITRDGILFDAFKMYTNIRREFIFIYNGLANILKML